MCPEMQELQLGLILYNGEVSWLRFNCEGSYSLCVQRTQNIFPFSFCHLNLLWLQMELLPRTFDCLGKGSSRAPDGVGDSRRAGWGQAGSALPAQPGLRATEPTRCLTGGAELRGSKSLEKPASLPEPPMTVPVEHSPWAALWEQWGQVAPGLGSGFPSPLPRAPLRPSWRTWLGAPGPRGFAASHIQIQSQPVWHPDKPNETGRGQQAGQPWPGSCPLSPVSTWAPHSHRFQRAERRAFSNQGGELTPGAPK